MWLKVYWAEDFLWDDGCGMMGLPSPVSPRPYSEHNGKLHEISKETSLESFSSASTYHHRLQGAGPDYLIDVTVTCYST